MNDWVEFIGPLPEDIFDNLLKLHPILGMKELHQNISNISDNKVDELLEHFCGNQHMFRNDFLQCLKSLYVEQNISFDWKFLDTGLVYHFKDIYDFMLFKPLCPAALNALLDMYKDFPFLRDMLKHGDILLKAMGLAGKPTTDVHIKFEHFILLDKDQLTSNSQHSKFLICDYECYPQFDFIIGYIFIQMAVIKEIK
ncbi:hypothetical protein RhiirA1_450888 [Rhizophagus irregularis]|uniref:Uncharacterized protein n=1 Tax=Rhizophagus irregularis TaxID=588596 RepID=A0A2N0SDS1_9GLOM|nr:hypothetical protein RhiirA1_450888 [Rhizophagus irregularis]